MPYDIKYCHCKRSHLIANFSKFLVDSVNRKLRVFMLHNIVWTTDSKITLIGLICRCEEFNQYLMKYIEEL